MDLHNTPPNTPPNERPDEHPARPPAPPRTAPSRPLATAEMRGLSAVAPRRWLTEDWRARRMMRLRRLGEWAVMTRARLGLTTRQIEQLATRDGEDISQGTWLRIEWMRRPDVDLTHGRRLSLTAVDWMATLAGQTLADVDRYLRSGVPADLEPSVETRADGVRSAYLSLSPARRQALEDFTAHLYHLDELDYGMTGGMTGAMLPTPFTSMPSGAQAVTPDEDEAVARTAEAAQAEVLNVRAQLEEAQTRLLELEAREAGKTTGQTTSQAGTAREQRPPGRPRRKRVGGDATDEPPDTTRQQA